MPRSNNNSRGDSLADDGTSVGDDNTYDTPISNVGGRRGGNNRYLTKMFIICAEDAAGSVHRAWAATVILMTIFFIVSFIEGKRTACDVRFSEFAIFIHFRLRHRKMMIQRLIIYIYIIPIPFFHPTYILITISKKVARGWYCSIIRISNSLMLVSHTASYCGSIGYSRPKALLNVIYCGLLLGNDSSHVTTESSIMCGILSLQTWE